MNWKIPPFVLCIVLTTNAILAQPGGGGGLQIMKIYDTDGFLISKSDTDLQVRQFILSGKKYKVKKEIHPETMNSYYRYANDVYTHIFLPSYYIPKGTQAMLIPNQRLQLIYQGDTMTIDIIGIMGENAAGNTDHMEKIEFKPGYFRCYRNPPQSHPKFWNDPALTARQKDEIYRLLYHGLDVSSVYQLQNLGLIEYKPPVASGIIKPETKKKISCVDTTDPNNGYTRLCPDNIRIKDSSVALTIAAHPLMTDSGELYKLFYYHVTDVSAIGRINNSEYKDMYTFFKEIRTATLTINQRLFSGCVHLATLTMNVGLWRYPVYSVLFLYYKDGKLIREESLYDVDLRNERVIMARPA